ncbi:MAG: hypothetical protein U5K71_17045 [Gracilimonas sp.]|nr:hypothetical protein [Gracilimonas sp.]
MENKKKYKLQVEFDVEVSEGDTEFLVHDEDQRKAAEELIKFLYDNEEVLKRHVLMILTEELEYFIEEDKVSNRYDVLPIIKEGISDIAWNRLNLDFGEPKSVIFDELYRMVNIKAEIQPGLFKQTN